MNRIQYDGISIVGIETWPRPKKLRGRSHENELSWDLRPRLSEY